LSAQDDLENRLDQARQLLARLERVSADSIWAHRSSGYRGSLLKWIDHTEKQLAGDLPHAGSDRAHFELLYTTGLELLSKAARESLSKRGFKR
jgi:hypothetical protein